MSDPTDAPGPTGDGHAGDLVSAYVDGELDAETTARIDAHLATCADCRDAAEAAASVRDWIRAAPPGDARPVVEGVIARRRRLVATGTAFVGAALVVLGLLAVTASVVHPEVEPDIERMVAAHAAAAHHAMDGMAPAEEGGRHYAAPDRVEGRWGTLHRIALYDRADMTTVVYDGDAGRVSVFEQPGRVDWDDLEDGSRSEIDGRDVWVRSGTPVVVVAEVGHLVVTVVADDDVAATGVVRRLPEPVRDSVADRIHDSCQRLTEIFALGG